MNSRLPQFARSLAAAKVRALYLAIFSTFFLGLSVHAFGQEATILGTVTDSSGSVVPNVTVTLTQTETGEARTSTTNDTGQYVAPGLPIGHYNVAVKAAGFGPVERTGVTVNVND